MPPSSPHQTVPLASLPPQVVQPLPALWPLPDLQQAAAAAQQPLLHADLAQAHTRQDVLAQLGQQLALPPHYGQNLDALYDCLTDLEAPEQAGPPAGWVLVLERLPHIPGFSPDRLLDCLQDVADFWAGRERAFRCFYTLRPAA